MWNAKLHKSYVSNKIIIVQNEIKINSENCRIDAKLNIILRYKYTFMIIKSKNKSENYSVTVNIQGIASTTNAWKFKSRSEWKDEPSCAPIVFRCRRKQIVILWYRNTFTTYLWATKPRSRHSAPVPGLPHTGRSPPPSFAATRPLLKCAAKRSAIPFPISATMQGSSNQTHISTTNWKQTEITTEKHTTSRRQTAW